MGRSKDTATKDVATKEVVKKAGFFVAVKKGLGKLTKLAMVAGIGAAVVKALRGREA